MASFLASPRPDFQVQYDPETHTATVTCLEGSCRLENAGQAVELVAGQSAQVVGAENPPSEPRPMTKAEVNEWLANNPEATLAPLPTPAPSNTPEPTATPEPSPTTAPTATPIPPSAPPASTPEPTAALPAAGASPPPPSGGDGGYTGGGPICFDAETWEQIECPAGITGP